MNGSPVIGPGAIRFFGKGGVAAEHQDCRVSNRPHLASLRRGGLYWMIAAVAAEAATPVSGDSQLVTSENRVLCTLITSPG